MRHWNRDTIREGINRARGCASVEMPGEQIRELFELAEVAICRGPVVVDPAKQQKPQRGTARAWLNNLCTPTRCSAENCAWFDSRPPRED